MSEPVPLCTLKGVLDAVAVTVVGDVDDAALSAPITRAIVWMPGDHIPQDPSTLVVHPGTITTAKQLEPFASAAGAGGAAIVAARFALRRRPPDSLTLVELGQVNAAELTAAIVRLTTPSTENAVTRRLTAVQRSLSLALSEPNPEETLLSRLKRACNATVAVIDRAGRIVASTGPLPQALLFGKIGETAADSQYFDVDGWRGVAARLEAADGSGSHGGWLVASARRNDFPDAYSTSSVHVAATILEASRRMTFVARASTLR